ncbi:MAG TPA: NAD-dependent malic enzyme [Candidatus Acidoferrum sp.]|nr:NAD-dependent malic enzyme [Candidatus Acidoferrum sp.]
MKPHLERRRLRGSELLYRPELNKGTAFTNEERMDFGLHGLLPPQIETLEEQVHRAYLAYQRKDDDLERHIYLRQLQDNNSVLFYRLLLDHIEEMMPIVYTPVVALGCQQFSKIYRRPRGLFVSYPLKDSIPMLLRNRPREEVDVIVVTDGERVLGIGDQGVGGMGIPIGKLSLYTLIGGIHPTRTLPIVLDVGTNNKQLVSDPQYLGWRHERVTGAEYMDFVECFVAAVMQEIPGVLLQWEDFATRNARPILTKYQNRLLTFNDDIQGTAAVALGALLAAVYVTSKKLSEQQIVMLGAGSAGIGVADYLRATMVKEGLSEKEAARRFWIIDMDGLLVRGRAGLSPEQAAYARDPEEVSGWRVANAGIGLEEVMNRVPATMLIGLSTVAGAFTESIVRKMASRVERPIIFPLSNPTEHSEAKPEDLLEWTDGRALIATGSPFAAVQFRGREVRIDQCNNVYVFPAVGLGVTAAKAARVTDGMMLAAARTLGKASPALRDPGSSLLPALTELRDVAIDIAFAVAQEAQREGVAPPMPGGDIALRKKILVTRWTPEYGDILQTS